MANFFNVVGSQTITAGNEKDQFFAFTRLANLDYVRPDAVVAQLVWNPGSSPAAAPPINSRPPTSRFPWTC